jgi:hypothetical protein
MKPRIEDIALFYKKGSSKETNDSENRIREDILVFLEKELPPEYADNLRWSYLYARFHETLKSICPTEYDHLQIIKKGGRSFNYDFEIIYFNSSNNEIHRAKVEFKHNTSTIDKMPQILSLQDKFGLIGAMSYSEYYYTHYLDAYLAVIGYTGDKPSLTEYVALVAGTAHEKHPMFGYMRKAESGPCKAESADIVKESIHTYLYKYIVKFKVDEFSNKLIESQKNKYFLLWDLKRFHVDMLTEKDLQILHINIKPSKKNANTVIALSVKYEFQLLLRWRNHNGILNPAWQIKATKFKSR